MAKFNQRAMRRIDIFRGFAGSLELLKTVNIRAQVEFYAPGVATRVRFPCLLVIASGVALDLNAILELRQRMQRKIFSFGLVIYILLLLTQPCPDLFARVREHDRGASSTMSKNAPTDSQSEFEECSALCTCGCCGFSVAHRTFSSIGINEIVIHALHRSPDIYRDPYDPTYATAIWQPPKV